MSVQGDRSYLSPIGTSSGAHADLICFPHAGAGASAFMRWRRFIPSSIGLFALHMPGREDRSLEPPPESLTDAVNAVLRAMTGLHRRPYVLFGHSLGALIAFELARAVRNAGLPPPAALIVSAAHPPHHKPSDPPIAQLPDEPFLQEAARRYGGLAPESLGDREMTQWIAPVLRCDIGLFERYVFRPEAALPHPIVAYGGTADTQVPYHALSGWRSHTSSQFRVRVFRGDHFYPFHALPAVTRAVAAEVEDAVRACSELYRTS
jgi:medium-chain acyl-[acyl-carrier-protein] hydrolase